MADRIEIIDALENLAVHCRTPIMDVDSRSRWMVTWCEDLAEYPVEAIRAACRSWRQSDATKFPTPGQLLPLVRSASPRQAEAGSAERPWTWPSDADLHGMTLRERRRQYLIMASETRSKVGPMTNGGEYPRPEFLREAKGFLEEAQRCAGRVARAVDRDTHTAEPTHNAA